MSETAAKEALEPDIPPSATGAGIQQTRTSYLPHQAVSAAVIPRESRCIALTIPQ